MRPQIATGIDIGSSQIKVVVVERTSERQPRIVGRGQAESKGMRHGYIMSTPDIYRALKFAINQAQKSAGLEIRSAHLSVGGIGLESFSMNGSTTVSRADFEVTENDIKLAHDAAESALPQSFVMNRRILHAIPINYKLDNREILGRPQGMKGGKLEVKMLFITTLEQHLNDMLSVVEETGIEVIDVMAAPLASSLVNLTKPQKMAGCILANIGAETLSMVIYENNVPHWLGVFPMGSTDVTNDIALGFRVSLEEAEEIKRGVIGFSTLPRKELNEIIEARLYDMFELIEAQLKKMGRSGLLPAGVIITGGGSGFIKIDEMAKEALRLPSRVALPLGFRSPGQVLPDSSWSVAYGLGVWGLDSLETQSLINFKIVKKLKDRLIMALKNLLP